MKMKSSISVCLAPICALSLMSPVAADDTINLTPLFRDVVAGTAGVETIVPVFRVVDSNADGYPNALYVKFDVYEGGTNTKLNSSAWKGIAFQAMPCASPYSWEWDWEPKFFGTSPSTRGTVAIGMEVSCYENTTFEWKEAQATFVYSAQLASADASPWTHYQPRGVIGANGIDINEDTTNELVLATEHRPIPGDDRYADAVITFINFGTGAVLNQKFYPLLRP